MFIELFILVMKPFLAFCAAAAVWDWIGKKILDKWDN